MADAFFCFVCSAPVRMFEWACPPCKKAHREACMVKKKHNRLREPKGEPTVLTPDHPDHPHWLPSYARKRGITRVVP